MAFVIVSAGHLSDSRLRMVRAQPLLTAAAFCVLLLMAACVTLGLHLGRYITPVGDAPTTRLSEPEMDVLASRIGTLTGRLAQLEQKAASLAQRLGTAPLHAALASRPRADSAGGPMIPASDIERLEADMGRLDGTLAFLSEAAVEHELESMAYPNRMPVAGQRIPVSSSFGTRHDPFTGRLARHTGLDIPASYGTPILASGGGRVVFAGYKGAYGQAVVIDHGDGLATLYGHASRLLVHVGDVALPQQKIALVGSTGRSTGPHLHFEVIRDGGRVEPRQYLARVLDHSVETMPQ